LSFSFYTPLEDGRRVFLLCPLPSDLCSSPYRESVETRKDQHESIPHIKSISPGSSSLLCENFISLSNKWIIHTLLVCGPYKSVMLLK
jgi:hypothetical protein